MQCFISLSLIVACRRTFISFLFDEVWEVFEEGETVGANFFFDFDTFNSGLLAAHSWLLANSMALFILPLNGFAFHFVFFLDQLFIVLGVPYLYEVTLQIHLRFLNELWSLLTPALDLARVANDDTFDFVQESQGGLAIYFTLANLFNMNMLDFSSELLKELAWVKDLILRFLRFCITRSISGSISSCSSGISL